MDILSGAIAYVGQLAVEFGALAGYAALVAALINVGKAFGVVKDGQAGNYATALTLLGFAAFVGFRLFVPTVSVPGLDGVAAQLAAALMQLLAVAVALGLPAYWHDRFSFNRLPVIGKSFSLTDSD